MVNLLTFYEKSSNSEKKVFDKIEFRILLEIINSIFRFFLLYRNALMYGVNRIHDFDINFYMAITVYETCDPFLSTTLFGLPESS